MDAAIRDHPIAENERRVSSAIQNVEFAVLVESIIELPPTRLSIKVPNILRLLPLFVLAPKYRYLVTVTDDG